MAKPNKKLSPEDIQILTDFANELWAKARQTPEHQAWVKAHHFWSFGKPDDVAEAYHEMNRLRDAYEATAAMQAYKKVSQDIVAFS